MGSDWAKQLSLFPEPLVTMRFRRWEWCVTPDGGTSDGVFVASHRSVDGRGESEEEALTDLARELMADRTGPDEVRFAPNTDELHAVSGHRSVLALANALRQWVGPVAVYF